MKIGWISQEGSEVFRSLLLPDAAGALAAGEPLTALGLTEGDAACGAAAGWLSGGMFSLRSLYVAPDFRRRGGGRMLMEALQTAAADYCTALEASYTATRPEHDTLPPFLTAMGFTEEKSRDAVRGVRLGALEDNAFFSVHGKANAAGVQTFDQIPEGVLSRAYRGAAAREEAYLPDGLTSPTVDRTVSVGIADKTDLRSFAAVERLGERLVSLSWLRCGKSQDVIPLLSALYRRLRESYPPQTVLAIQAVNEPSKALLDRLVPEAEILSHTWLCAL